MAIGSRQPRVVYAANARVLLAELSQRFGRTMTLADIADERLAELVTLGVDLVWLIGIWPTGRRSAEIARSHPDLQPDYRRALPDFAPEKDVAGSPYAPAAYTVDPALGGSAGLATLRERLRVNGIGLILDFVVNHTGLDHPWLFERPELYIHGTAQDFESAPRSFFRVETKAGTNCIAHGRDPYFPSWTDTAQLNLVNPATHEALSAELQNIAAQCDGVRCDMAMLALDSVCRQTWGRYLPRESRGGQEFWRLAIDEVHKKHPNFLFIAEAYWGLENDLRQLGFQYTYDKTLYDRLAHGDAEGIRLHLTADVGWQSGCVRFLENHDEGRAATSFPWDRHKAAAVIASTVPGLILLHDGQLEGRTIKVPIQLRRRPAENTNETIRGFYGLLLRTLAHDPAIHRGRWFLLPLRAAWKDNPTWKNFIAYCWKANSAQIRLIVVNFGPSQGQCYVDLHPVEMNHAASKYEFRDLLAADGGGCYAYGLDQLLSQGLYLDMPAFGFHVFVVRPTGQV